MSEKALNSLLACRRVLLDPGGYLVLCDRKLGHEPPCGAENLRGEYVPVGDGRLRYRDEQHEHEAA